MATIGTRQSTRQRAEQASLFKSVGYTWQQIADNLGYGSRQAAQQAATRFEAKNPPESVEAARRREGEALRIIKATLFERFADAKQRGDNDAMVLLSKELRNTSDAIARLNGSIFRWPNRWRSPSAARRRPSSPRPANGCCP